MRMVTLLLALGVIGGICYFALRGDPSKGDATAPKQQMDQVRAKTGQFEKDAQDHADKVMRDSQEQ